MQRPHCTGVANGASGGCTIAGRLPRLILVFLSFGLLSSATVAVAEGPGLYKDGQKLIDFQDVISSSLGQLGEPREPRSAALEALHQPVSDATRSRPFPERDTYLRNIRQCRLLVQRAVEEGSVLPSAGEMARLLSLQDDISRTGQVLLTRYERMANDLARAGFSPEKLARHTEVVERLRQSSARLVGFLADLSAAETAGDQAGSAQVLYELQQFFTDQSRPPDPALWDATPRPMALEPVALPPISDDAEVRRPVAYPLASAQAPSFDPADLSETIEVQFTDDIVALAAELNHSPVAIYEYMRNNFTFETYLGSRKGAQQTLDHMRGNDYDCASLMIALLRVSGIPARYAGGRSYVTADRVKSWLGFDDLYSAAIMLHSTGFQVSLHGPSGDTTGLSFERVWVEAWAPFVNYRGAVNDGLGYMWVPLDPAFKQYDYDPGIYLYGEMNFDAGLFLSDYYSTFHADPPIEAFKQLMLDSLAVYHPGATYDDIFRSRTVIAEADGILPGTLPYELLTYYGTFSEVPADMRYGIGFHVYNAGASLSYTTTLPEIAAKQLTLSYVGATAGDQNIIDTAGGIWNIEVPWMVDLVPVVKVDGCEVARGTGAVMMGDVQNSDMSFTPPNGAPVQSPFVYNYITAGNSQGLGVDTEDALPSFPESPETACAEDNLPQVLHQTSLTYLNNVDMADDELAGLMHVVLTNDIAEAIVENTVSVGYGPSGAVSFTWTGMIVDADRKILGPYSVYGHDILCDFMKIGGADGSVQENRLFETLFDIEAVSTIKIFEICSDSGIALCTLTSGGLTCASLNQPPHVISAINACVMGGSEIVVPQSQLTYFNWTGTGWTCMNPAGCGAGYIISGGKSGELHAGGETVEDWDVTYPNLLCIQPIGPITVSPSATGDYYCGESSARLTFNVPTVKYWGLDEDLDCVLLQSSSKSFPMQYTISQIANKWGGGEYVFEIGSAITTCGCTSLEKRVKIVVVRYEDVTEPLTICKDQVRPVAVTVTPSDAPVTWLSGDTDVLTLTSATAPFSMTGADGGLSTIQPMLNGIACYEAKAIQVIKIDLTDCPPAWLPEGRQYGTATGDPGNSVQFTATIQGGAMAKIRFWLLGASSEPGVCINYGDETAKDLKLIQSATVNPPEIYDAPIADGIIIQTKEEVNSATVTVTCYDWGAWGKIQACVIDDKGEECGCTDTKKMPVDDLPAAGNHLADAWYPAHAIYPTTWDGDKHPENMKCDGDGFTFYEEYRGAMTGFIGTHTRLDPLTKDLFLYDEHLLHLEGDAYNKFIFLTLIDIHYLNVDPVKLMNGTGLAAAGHRVVNHKSSAAVKLHNQFALHVRERDLGGQGSWGEVDGAVLGPPESADPAVNIDKAQVALDLADAIRDQGGDPAGAEAAAYATVSSREIGSTITHEMGHGVNVLEPTIHHVAANGGRNSPYGAEHCGDAACVMRYDFDLVDAPDATHLKIYGMRTLALSPVGTLPGRFEFSNYTNKDLSDLTPVANTFCTANDKCRKSIDVKDK